MGKNTVRGKDLRKMGFPKTNAVAIALGLAERNLKRQSKEDKLDLLAAILANPEDFLADETWSKLAEALMPDEDELPEISLKEEVTEYAIFGSKHIQDEALAQMDIAMKLPVAKSGALMPDAHAGYGLPIGGVLAAENAVIPYAVGMDIGCRMSLSVFAINPSLLKGHKARLQNLLHEHTRFGMGSEFRKPGDHEILSRSEFDEIELLRNLRDKARRQLGSSGSGNHFVEFGTVEIKEISPELRLEPGAYVGLLSHSGSRGLGASIAGHYAALARSLCPLPRQASHLAWLDLDTQEGQEYWLGMTLAGDYASACHDEIHRKLSRALGESPLVRVENHHNFAWKEELPDGSTAIVHRKGATPAAQGVLGIIPGSMVHPGYIVRGKGSARSLNSASHGAGRAMSRSRARNNITRHALKEQLKAHGVSLIGGGLDEAPMAYKDIDLVMSQQRKLVDVLGSFQPRIVRMDDA